MISLHIAYWAVGAGLTTALVLIAVLVRLASTKANIDSIHHKVSDDEIVFVFDSIHLVDATIRARNLLPRSPEGISDWGKLIVTFAHRFENLAEDLTEIPEGGSLTLVESGDDPERLTLLAERRNDLLRIVMSDVSLKESSQFVERYSMAAMRSELATLRSVAENTPIATWKRRDDGTITWANSAYMSLAKSEEGPEALFGWPPPDIFKDVSIPDTGEVEVKRISLPSRHSQSPLWFELTVMPGESESLLFADAIDEQVRAETALSAFIQTLTKTFAHLTIGLAIFDHDRHLALFNPALIDLTGIQPELLSSRPTLHSFLDELRERQRIPEPKDYKSWRLHVAQLEVGAAEGTYEQTWHLPTGQTYRVTGRPHPDGAVAYMFEDISSEISLTRSFRSEIEMGQSVLDSLEDAIAVFSESGVLTMSNAAYRKLWQVDPSTAIGEIAISDAAEHWQNCCQDSVVWTKIRRFILDDQDRAPFTQTVVLNDTRSLACSVSPLVGRATLVRFQHTSNEVPFPQSQIIDATKASA